jgi:hypothetical protein
VRQASRVQEALELSPVALTALDALQQSLAGKPELAGDGRS